MNACIPPDYPIDTERFARCIAVSKRVSWDIDADVIRGRHFDLEHKFLPEGLSFAGRLPCLSEEEQRYLSQVQGRTYANMFGLVERFIDAKVVEVSRDHVLGDQTAREALLRFSEEEVKHQKLFRRVEWLAAEAMAPGYSFAWNPNEVAAAVLGKGSWAVLGLTLLIELFTQVHFRESIGCDETLSPLFRDVFLFHWKEECQHAVLDELEWRRADAGLSPQARDAAVDDLIGLIGAVDGILQAQAAADADYFARTCGRLLPAGERASVAATVLAAYRYQYILSGAHHAGFLKVLGSLVTHDQLARIAAALPVG